MWSLVRKVWCLGLHILHLYVSSCSREYRCLWGQGCMELTCIYPLLGLMLPQWSQVTEFIEHAVWSPPNTSSSCNASCLKKKSVYSNKWLNSKQDSRENLHHDSSHVNKSYSLKIAGKRIFKWPTFVEKKQSKAKQQPTSSGDRNDVSRFTPTTY